MSYPNPILNLDFVNSKQLGDKVAFSRSSPATFWDRNGVLRTAVDGMPRFDHDPLTGICKGLLVEPQVAFLETYSEQMDLWDKSAGVAVTANAALAPDGTMTADKVVHSNVSRDEFIYRSGVFSNGAVSGYCFLKKDEHRYVFVEISDLVNASVNVVVDLETGTGSSLDAVSPWTGGGYKVDDVGSGWYKVTIWGVAAQGTQKAIVIHPSSSAGRYFAGNGSDGFYIWGAKLYAGTGPTSYLPSVASPVTRNPDLASVDLTQLKGPAGEALWNGSEGTIVVDAIVPNSTPAGADYQMLFGVDAGSAANRLYCFRSSPAELAAYIAVGGSVVKGFNFGPVSQGSRIKLAFASSSLNHALSLNGSAVATDNTAGQPIGMNTMRIGATPGGAYQWGGHFCSIQLYNKRIADAYLPALSAL